ncbi:hypothetical protein BDC45DRAFT_499456 [Circinella umbellata]|nr:hypothetical protein BDC45DRAFT_499456 [Circinella umbellata]
MIRPTFRCHVLIIIVSNCNFKFLNVIKIQPFVFKVFFVQCMVTIINSHHVNVIAT